MEYNKGIKREWEVKVKEPIDCPTCDGHGIVKDNGKKIECPECKGFTYVYVHEEPKKKYERLKND